MKQQKSSVSLTLPAEGSLFHSKYTIQMFTLVQLAKAGQVLVSLLPASPGKLIIRGRVKFIGFKGYRPGFQFLAAL